MKLALVDSGTTRTRLRVADEDGLISWRGEAHVGARDGVRAGAGPLRAALAELLEGAHAAAPFSGVVCSGMITSNIGLREVPHVAAPAGAAELARAASRTPDPLRPDLPWLFVPGVKTVPAPLSWDTLPLADVLRGEEVEVLGLSEGGATHFLHLGSHHKAVTLGVDGRIVSSRTALTGEALAALSAHTVLRGSVSDLAVWPAPEPELWRRGLTAAREYGVGRALFLVRLADLLLGASHEEAAAYLLGALSALTLELLSGEAPLVIYGQEELGQLLADERRAGGREARVADAAEVERAAVRGAWQVWRAAQVET